LYDAGVQRAPRVARSVDATPGGPREVVVAIDAGHGGEDPGAIGRRGTREKDVVLAVAKRLERLVNQEPGMRAVMIRDGDYYVDLKRRVALAREKRADLFISIHADAFHDHRAKGSSVYTLSTRGATSEAASWLADKENAADLIGGVSLDDKDDLVAAVLLDLSQSASLEASHEVATHVLSGLKSVSKLHKRSVERAGFRVLKAPDVPSILVETAFISNPKEESKLVTARYQQSLAQAMMNGLRTYFRQNPPPDSLLAIRERRHVIAHGETLSGIARSYRVNLERLREANGLTTDMLRVGEVLRIPHGS
jgi:N-acetylmuramoyl-L-alanine amidase